MKASGDARSPFCVAVAGGGLRRARPTTIVEDPFDIAETAGAPEVTRDRRRRRRRRAAVGPLGDGGLRRRRGHRRDALDPRQLVRAPADRRSWAAGPAAVLGRTRDGGIVVRVPPATPSGSQAVVGQQRGRQERAPDHRPPLRRRAGAGQRPDRLGRARRRRPDRRRRHARPGRALAGAVAATAAPPTSPRRAGAAIDVIDLPAPGAPKVDLPAASSGPRAAGAGAGRGGARARAGGRARERRRAASTRRSPLHPARSDAARVPAGGARRARSSPPTSRPTASCWRSPPRRAIRWCCSTSARAATRRSPACSPSRPRSARASSRDVAFSPAGDTLWVLSGDTPRSARGRPAADRAARGAARRATPQTLATLDGGARGRDRRRGRAGAARRRARVAAGERRRDPAAARAQHRLLRAPAAPRRRDGAQPAIFRVGAEDAATRCIAAPGAPRAPGHLARRALAAGAGGRPRRRGPRAGGRHRRAPGAAGLGPRRSTCIAAAAGRAAAGATRPAPELRIQP